MNNEKTEMLTAYDENFNPIGEFPRSEIHERSMLHRTVRIWLIDGNGSIWFQKRSMSKALFPGKLDPTATGHVDPGESMAEAARRELKEETGLDAGENGLIHAGDIPFSFTRPDGRLDNEYASIFVYIMNGTPKLEISDEVDSFMIMRPEDYASKIKAGDTGSFCCASKPELDLVMRAIRSAG